jgi:NTP pyrophosphatase (non-canonical NTP hydrolase)
MNTQELNELIGCLVSNRPKLKKVCDTWGNQPMLTVAMEENAEMIQAISKIKRYGPNLDNSSHLNEEVADVLICICELFVMGYLDVHEIAKIIERKVERSMIRTQDYIYESEAEARCNGEF